MERIHPQNENAVPTGHCSPLPEATSLHRRYTVRRVTGFDDCSITYDGFDFQARQPVSIIEFFPGKIAMRAASSGTVSPVNRASGALYFLASEAFLSQYGTLTQAIGSPNIISVFDAFFENGTAYAVTERADGLTLSEYLHMQDRNLTQGELAYITGALADALLIIHSLNILHHRITAERILLCPDGTVKLTGFCAAHETVRRGRSVAADEPFSDIRALGQALYQAFAGTKAPRGGKPLAPAVSGTLSTLFEGMLTDNAALRFSSVFDLRHAVGGLDIALERPHMSYAQIDAFRSAQRTAPRAPRNQPAQPDSVPADEPRPPRGKKEARGLLIGISALIFVLIVTLIVFLMQR